MCSPPRCSTKFYDKGQYFPKNNAGGAETQTAFCPGGLSAAVLARSLSFSAEMQKSSSGLSLPEDF
jgi:hypothetical protein